MDWLEPGKSPPLYLFGRLLNKKSILKRMLMFDYQGAKQSVSLTILSVMAIFLIKQFFLFNAVRGNQT